MKNFLLILAGFTLAILVLGGAGLVYAQTQNPPAVEFQDCPFCDGDGQLQQGPGMMWGGRSAGFEGRHPGMRGGFTSGGFAADGEEMGLMHDTMLAAFAAALNLDVTELETRLEAGETLAEIAAPAGLSTDDFQALMFTAREEALAQAVADGAISQEQADWMLERWNNMQQNGYGPGSGLCQDGEYQNMHGPGGRGGRMGGRQP
ncbi:MAG: hypothetical protein JW862_18590 [Anaerolineales bacterium]|nr:hypothetical protein [Anaerolineales bacterium]